MPAVAALSDEPMSSKNGKLLRNTGMRDSERLGQPVYVDLSAPEFFNDTNAIGMGENSEEFGKFSADECPSWHILM
jgi:hypothetical protein